MRHIHLHMRTHTWTTYCKGNAYECAICGFSQNLGCHLRFKRHMRIQMNSSGEIRSPSWYRWKYTYKQINTYTHINIHKITVRHENRRNNAKRTILQVKIIWNTWLRAHTSAQVSMLVCVYNNFICHTQIYISFHPLYMRIFI